MKVYIALVILLVLSWLGGSAVGDETGSPRGIDPCEFGDFNGDGITFGPADIPGFVDALMCNNPNPLCGDINLDGFVDGRDIQPFINLVLAP